MIEKTISDIIKKQEKMELYLAMIDALTKQLPYKPIAYPGYMGKCLCGALFLDKSTYYCGNCGQKLDWGEKL